MGSVANGLEGGRRFRDLHTTDEVGTTEKNITTHLSVEKSGGKLYFEYSFAKKIWGGKLKQGVKKGGGKCIAFLCARDSQ